MRFLGVAVVEWSKLLLRTALQFKTDKRRNVPMHGKLVEIIVANNQTKMCVCVCVCVCTVDNKCCNCSIWLYANNNYTRSRIEPGTFCTEGDTELFRTVIPVLFIEVSLK